MNDETKFAHYVIQRFRPAVEELMQATAQCGKAGLIATIHKWERVYLEVASGWSQHEASTATYNDGFGEQSYPVTAMAVYTHDVGLEDKTESYIFSDLDDLISPHCFAWGEKKLGVFKEIRPLSPNHVVSPYRRLVISYSLKESRSRGYYAREELKKWLPPKLRKHISKLRGSLRRTSKRAVLMYISPKWGKNKHLDTPLEELPDWFRNSTKAELHVRFLMDEQLKRDLEPYIDPLDFLLIANGKVHPHDVLEKINPLKRMKQLKLL